MIKGVIFGLDRCIYDVETQNIDVLDPVIEALEDADIHRFFDKSDVEDIKEALWTRPFDEVLATFNIPPQLANHLKKAYQHLRADHSIQPYSDIVVLPHLNQRKILVTRGFKEYQNSKIQALGITPYFDEVHIDSIDDGNKGKKAIFQDILQKHGWKPNEVLVIGNDVHRAIKAAKEIGMKTAQALRPGVRKAESVDYFLRSLEDLNAVLTANETKIVRKKLMPMAAKMQV